jgi:hypothetical protein
MQLGHPAAFPFRREANHDPVNEPTESSFRRVHEDGGTDQREAVLEGVRQVDPQTRAALLKIRRGADPTLEAAPHVVEEDEIFPTRLDLIVAYIPGTANNRPIHYLRPEGTGYAD